MAACTNLISMHHSVSFHPSSSGAVLSCFIAMIHQIDVLAMERNHPLCDQNHCNWVAFLSKLCRFLIYTSCKMYRKVANYLVQLLLANWIWQISYCECCQWHSLLYVNVGIQSKLLKNLLRNMCLNHCTRHSFSCQWQLKIYHNPIRQEQNHSHVWNSITHQCCMFIALVDHHYYAFNYELLQFCSLDPLVRFFLWF